MSREVEDLNRRLLRARDAMDRAYAEPLDVRAVAAVAHVSEAHFIRTWAVWETPHRYLQRRRVERSMFLLRETDRSVTDICFDVGFTSLGTFSRTFREIVGETPSGYRAGNGPIVAPNCVQMAHATAGSGGRGDAIEQLGEAPAAAARRVRLSAIETPTRRRDADTKTKVGPRPRSRCGPTRRTASMEHAAMKAARGKKLDGEADLLAKIADMPPTIARWPSWSTPHDHRAGAHAGKNLVRDARLRQGRQAHLLLPAGGQVQGQVRDLRLRGTRNIDEGTMWPTSWALTTELTAADEASIAALVKKARAEETPDDHEPERRLHLRPRQGRGARLLRQQARARGGSRFHAG